MCCIVDVHWACSLLQSEHQFGWIHFVMHYFSWSESVWYDRNSDVNYSVATCYSWCWKVLPTSSHQLKLLGWIGWCMQHGSPFSSLHYISLFDKCEWHGKMIAQCSGTSLNSDLNTIIIPAAPYLCYVIVSHVLPKS